MFKFNKKLTLTEREQQFENCVLKLLAKKETKKSLKLELNTTTILLINNKKHITIKLDCTGITLKNSKFSFKERLRDKVITHLKDLAIKNINQETDEELFKLDREETELLDRINCLF